MNLLMEVWSIDIAISPEFDLTVEQFQQLLMDPIAVGLFHLIMAAPPCNCWSIVR